MGLVSNEKKSAKDIGLFITSISDYQLNDGYFYESPRQLVYDNECEEELF